jgi:hypothetical protein
MFNPLLLTVVFIGLAINRAATQEVMASGPGSDQFKERAELVSAAFDRILEAQQEQADSLKARVESSRKREQQLTSDSSSIAAQINARSNVIQEQKRVVARARRNVLYSFHRGSAIVLNADERRFEALSREYISAKGELSRRFARLDQLSRDLGDTRSQRRASEASLAVALDRQARERASLNQLSSKWITGDRPDGENWVPLTAAITEAARVNGADCVVTFNSHPRTRIRLVYQTFDERLAGTNPHPLPNLTGTTEELPIGFYYVWFIENGVARSDPNFEVRAVQKAKTVTIQTY